MSNITAKDIEISSLIAKDFQERLIGAMQVSDNLTGAELARRCGMENSVSISRYIRGKRVPSLVNLKKIAAALGLTSQDLLGW